MALYPYTLQPIPCSLAREEFEQAQMELFAKTNKISTKIWLILAVIVALAIVGIVFVSGYSTVIFWLMLVGVVIYLLIRTLGLQWYMKRELAKQPIPPELAKLKVGVQKHGLVMSMPQGIHQATGVIGWEQVTQWYETPNYFFIMFAAKGQQGSQIVPKRLSAQKFPLDTLRHHLTEVKAESVK